jgi:hypothetical protein
MEPAKVLAEGVAHVSSVGEGIFVLVRGPYERQMLVEQVAGRVRAEGRVQVLVDDRRWLVSLRPAASVDWCSACGHLLLDSAWYSTIGAAAAYCGRCALGGHAERASRDGQPVNRAS